MKAKTYPPKMIQLFVLGLMSLGLGACGDEDKSIALDKDRYEIDNRDKESDWLEEQVATNLDNYWGRVDIDKSTSLGSYEVKKGGHSWKSLVSLTKKLAHKYRNDCEFEFQQSHYSQGQYPNSYENQDHYRQERRRVENILAVTDFQCLEERIDLVEKDSIYVTYENDHYRSYSLAHAMRQMFWALANAYRGQSQFRFSQFPPVYYQPAGSGFVNLQYQNGQFSVDGVLSGRFNW